MESYVTWAALIADIAAIITFVRFWMDMGETRSKAERADRIAHAVEQQLSEFRTMVARDYVSLQALATAEARFASAVEGFRADMRAMTERIDSLLVAIRHLQA